MNGMKAHCGRKQEADPNGLSQHEPGAKLDMFKVKAGLLLDFGRALLAVAEVGTYGAEKYTRGGWQHVPDGEERYMDALMRHLLTLTASPIDEETGMLAMAHVAWNALAMLELGLRNRAALDEIQTRTVTGYDATTKVATVNTPMDTSRYSADVLYWRNMDMTVKAEGVL